MDLFQVRERIAGDSRADQVARLIATADRIVADGRATRSRLQRRRSWITGGTAVALVAGGVGASLLSRGNEDDEPPTPSVRSTVGPPRSTPPTTTTPTTTTTPLNPAVTTLPPPPTSALANAPVGTGLSTTASTATTTPTS